MGMTNIMIGLFSVYARRTAPQPLRLGATGNQLRAPARPCEATLCRGKSAALPSRWFVPEARNTRRRAAETAEAEPLLVEGYQWMLARKSIFSSKNEPEAGREGIRS